MGLSRPSTPYFAAVPEDVVGRDKPGHDGETVVRPLNLTPMRLCPLGADPAARQLALDDRAGGQSLVPIHAAVPSAACRRLGHADRAAWVTSSSIAPREQSDQRLTVSYTDTTLLRWAPPGTPPPHTTRQLLANPTASPTPIASHRLDPGPRPPEYFGRRDNAAITHPRPRPGAQARLTATRKRRCGRPMRRHRTCAALVPHEAAACPVPRQLARRSTRGGATPCTVNRPHLVWGARPPDPWDESYYQVKSLRTRLLRRNRHGSETRGGAAESANPRTMPPSEHPARLHPPVPTKPDQLLREDPMHRGIGVARSRRRAPPAHQRKLFI